eukprot:scaffold107723_cov57-Phaeocystis_antarctica.AAC.1
MKWLSSSIVLRNWAKVGRVGVRVRYGSVRLRLVRVERGKQRAQRRDDIRPEEAAGEQDEGEESILDEVVRRDGAHAAEHGEQRGVQRYHVDRCHVAL